LLNLEKKNRPLGSVKGLCRQNIKKWLRSVKFWNKQPFFKIEGFGVVKLWNRYLRNLESSEMVKIQLRYKAFCYDSIILKTLEM